MNARNTLTPKVGGKSFEQPLADSRAAKLALDVHMQVSRIKPRDVAQDRPGETLFRAFSYSQLLPGKAPGARRMAERTKQDARYQRQCAAPALSAGKTLGVRTTG
ncbi:MAG TPA: hypothetical protein VHV54_21600, partial [Candidatus Binatia bacterium]|nr:hypothetical protein [Candidatus Binatia bacterium]